MPAPARALVARACTATRKLSLARRITCFHVRERTKSICPPPPPTSPRFSHTCSHPHTHARPLITHTHVHMHAGTHSRPCMAQRARANTCIQTGTSHGARHGAAVGPVPVALGPFLGYLRRRRRRSVCLAHEERTGGVRTRSAGARMSLLALAVVLGLAPAVGARGREGPATPVTRHGLVTWLGARGWCTGEGRSRHTRYAPRAGDLAPVQYRCTLGLAGKRPLVVLGFAL